MLKIKFLKTEWVILIGLKKYARKNFFILMLGKEDIRNVGYLKRIDLTSVDTFNV